MVYAGQVPFYGVEYCWNLADKRLVLFGIIMRFDLATGDEGFQTQLFITYPWSMFSVDDPGL